ncbi:hypothetical protein FDC22_00765 [Clostridium botulinum]|uniref:SIR2-like domain-containing protein n=2 Tax=Clostridium botulinum TaxID=1491 RepID=B1IFS1_CLOBK|nr:conserved hypothetical protein [Clostridium botulinum B1 str. Okra]EKX79604.1 hypothetical protein CFSAN001628_011908 [Clostridium botulinum CFSAN001628]MBD5562991.1 hypothetical protein [Clostridium botulinum]MBD5566492.1 hypothetical protein [Clostridium botulinum]MBD5568992.1 hypothetical protein [Clostridium botulinum]
MNEIDVLNLFKNGDKVPWLSDNEPGFLSYKRCPNLWNLGARPSNQDSSEASDIVENIITCANMYAYANRKSNQVNEENIYIKAYKELAIYLKYLFIFYNDKLTDKYIKEKISNWGWYNLFQCIKDNPNKFENITIITYNYDVWLERVLTIMGIKYNIVGLTNYEDSIVDIIKPHGSISFRSKRSLENSAFKINYNRDIIGAELDELTVDCDNLKIHSHINALIPPAGDSSRFSSSWSNKLHKVAKESANKLIPNDEVILCGLSYWHVDRLEIDEILLSLDSEVNFKIINPKIPSSLNAVVSSIFSNYVSYSSSDILGGLYE